MTIKEQILELLAKKPGLTDREITNHLYDTSARQQPINAACHKLVQAGLLLRTEKQAGQKIQNFLTGHAYKIQPMTNNQATSTLMDDNPNSGVSEDHLKSVLNEWLKSKGWEVQVAWGKRSGIDIDARRNSERWIIEVKGLGKHYNARRNYFFSLLGDLLQRMNDNHALYSIALPKIEQYEILWQRFPKLAKKRTRISIILIDENEKIFHLKD